MDNLPALAEVNHACFPKALGHCLILAPADDSPRACLDELLRVTEDLDGLFASHPEIDEARPRFGWAFQLPVRVLVESEFFPRAAAEAELRPLIETYVRRIIDRAGKGGPTFNVDEKTEAGSKAIESLVMADPDKYLPLYYSFLEIVDFEKTVEQHNVVQRIATMLPDAERALFQEALVRLRGDS